MILLIVLSLVCTVIESTRVSSAVTRANQVTYISMDSVFSSYAREVFEDYGIMVLWKNEEEIIEFYDTYVNNNLHYKYLTSGTDFYGINVKESVVSDIKYSTDNNGEFISNQIYDYMKCAVSEDIINELLEKCTDLSENEEVETFYDELEECNEILSDMEGCVEMISSNSDIVRNYYDNPKDVLYNMKINLENIISVKGDDDYAKDVRNNYFSIYKTYFRRYRDWYELTSESLDSIIDSTNQYKEKSTQAENYIDQMKENVELMEMEGLTQELSDVFWEELEVIDDEIINRENDVHLVYKNEAEVLKQKDILNNIITAMSDVIDENNELEYSGNQLSNYDNWELFINGTYESVCEALIYAKDYKSSDLCVNYKRNDGGSVKNEIVEFVEKIKNQGILNYVTSGKISDKKINTDELPSNIHSKNYTDVENSYMANSNVKKVLIGQYIFDKFSDYTDGKAKTLDYEIEYILEGYDSDKKNLESVANKIVGIRTGFNLIYLMKNTQKKNEAYQLALSIVGVTGMPVLVRITQFLIIGAWAYAESLVDVKDLLEGYKVKLIKEEEDWNLSLNGITKLFSESKSDKESRSGLTYQDYLRVMLFGQNSTEQIYRIMDMIEVNVQYKYNKNFRIQECVVSAKINTKYYVKRFFSMIGYNQDFISDKRRVFEFNVEQQIKY